MPSLPARKITVLVGDDHAPVRRFLSTLLENHGMRVVGEAANGRDAVGLCEQLHPDIVVLDIFMPLLDGFEAARQIRERSPASKIIFLTSNTGEEFVSEAVRVGAAGFVAKDCGTHGLLEAIEAVLQGKTHIRRHPPPNQKGA